METPTSIHLSIKAMNMNIGCAIKTSLCLAAAVLGGGGSIQGNDKFLSTGETSKCGKPIQAK